METPIVRRCSGVFFVFAMVLFIMSCSYFQSSPKSSGKPATQKTPRGSTPFYYDFGDVPLPKELSVIDKSTYIIEKASGYPEGILALKGRVTRNSLIAYFKNGMAKDNWQLVALFKSPRENSIMLFRKENRRCIINIQEKDFMTYVQVAVAPTVSESEGGLLK
ncbi:MAG: hypothetical protein JRH18_07765 [Deltaproteobacteria bacterium]|nr:hypothetical protein [Deltaproteobacteria bacterium]MBW1960984.1 hypothetical protein [Deltaproteobacteria bacterium]MBW2151547.1 hypothetical protein [Deltaproteobacteria bacterium]